MQLNKSQNYIKKQGQTNGQHILDFGQVHNKYGGVKVDLLDANSICTQCSYNPLQSFHLENATCLTESVDLLQKSIFKSVYRNKRRKILFSNIPVLPLVYFFQVQCHSGFLYLN